MKRIAKIITFSVTALCLALTAFRSIQAQPTNPINFVIISGSQQENSQSEKVAKFIENSIKQKGQPVTLISLYHEKLPLWEQPSEANTPLGHQIWKEKIAPKLAAADAIIIITPEYNGSASPAIKNFFLYPRGELAHKPVLLVGTSAGVGGAYPLAELRATSHKDTFAVYIPGNVIVRDAKDKLNVIDSPASPADKLLRTRLDYSLKVLEQYGIALKQVRESGVINLKEFPIGQ